MEKDLYLIKASRGLSLYNLNTIAGTLTHYLRFECNNETKKHRIFEVVLWEIYKRN